MCHRGPPPHRIFFFFIFWGSTMAWWSRFRHRWSFRRFRDIISWRAVPKPCWRWQFQSLLCLARANSRERFLPIPTLPLLFWDWSWVHWPSGKRGSVGDMYALSPLWPYMDWVGVLGLVFKPSLASPIDWTHTPAAYAPVAGTAIAGAPGQGHQMTPVWRVGWVLKLFEVQEYS